MQDTNYTISNNQAKQIANCIYLDIANYIKEHQEQYSCWYISKKGGIKDAKFK